MSELGLIDGIAREGVEPFCLLHPGEHDLPGVEAERITEADRALIARMEAEVLAAQRLQIFVTAHISATYGLKPGDGINDGLIVRAETACAE